MEKLVKTFTRDLSILTTQWWTVAQTVNFKKELGVAYKDNPASATGLAVTYYYFESDLEAVKKAFLAKLKKDANYYLKIRGAYREHVTATRNLLKQIEKKSLTVNIFEKVKRYFVDLYPVYRFTLLVPSTWSDDVKKMLGVKAEETIRAAFEDRLFSEGTFEAVDFAMQSLVKARLNAVGKSEKFSKFMTESEILALVKSEKINWDEIARRTCGYVYCKGKVCSTCDYRKVFAENKYFYSEEVHVGDLLKGTVACVGLTVAGKVHLLFSLEQVSEFKEGEVLVTPMTVPDFLPAMKKAVAIVTDEGGVTCHAAIVSRELKIPCLIGTKVATKWLKNGDLVEVDTVKGVVKKL